MFYKFEKHFALQKCLDLTKVTTHDHFEQVYMHLDININCGETVRCTVNDTLVPILSHSAVRARIAESLPNSA